MRIAEFTAYHVRIPLKKPVRHASYERRENETLIIRCRLDDGTTGWGEGLPRPYVTGETMDTVWQHVRETEFSNIFCGPVDDVVTAVQTCREFQPSHPGANHRDCFGNAFRCAVELSILDAVSRASGVPLSRVTEHVPETAPFRKRRDEVRYSVVLTSTRPLKQRLRAWMYRLYGFRQMKVKVGVEGSDDTATLRRVRKITGPRMDIRIDANEAWSCRTLEEQLAPLVPFGITSVEQPVPHAEVDGLADIRPRLGVPVMLDESLCSPGDARRSVDRATSDLFNIRLSKCGGFVNSLLIAAVAHQAGLGYQLGCQVGETGILSAAGRHFACSVGGIRYLEGSYDRHLVKEPLTREDLTFVRGGRAPALDGPGLGITVDERALTRITVREHRVPVHSLAQKPVS